MIIELALVVNGFTHIPLSYNVATTCVCVDHPRSVQCEISNGIFGGEFYTVVTTTDREGNPVHAEVTLQCGQAVH